MADQSIQGINAIAIARGTSEPSNTDVLWLDENLEGGLYSRLKAYISGEWKLISRIPQEILTDLKTVDGAGSGLDADTLRGLAPSDLIANLSTGQLLVGQSDAKGLAKTAGGVVTVNQNGIFAYVTNSISHTGLTDIGTNTHAQIDTHISSTANPHSVTASQVGNTVSQWNASSIEGNITNIGTLGASADGKAVVWDNATSRFVMSLVGLADGDYGDVTVGGSGTSITIDNGVVTNAKLTDVATSTIKGRATAGSGDTEDLTSTQVRTIINVEDGATADQTASEIKTAYESNADTNAFTDTEKTKLTGIEAGATTDQTDSEIETAYNNQVPAVTQAEAEAGTVTTVKRWTPERVKQAIDALASGGDSIYTADDSLTGDRIVSLDSNKLTFNPTTGNTTDLLGCNVSIKTPTGVKGVSNNGTHAFGIYDINENIIWQFLDNGKVNAEGSLIINRGGGGTFNSDFLVQGKTTLMASGNGSAYFGGWGTSGGLNITAMYEDGRMVIGGASPIGSEKISIQGDTSIFEKLTLSATDHGILLNRLTDLQMASLIATATDNEVIFNTDKHALYRFDTALNNWVALAAGFGIVGTTDNTGKPTFYATVKAAYEAGQGSIKLYSDINESVSRTINIVDGRDIDLNGFTYTYAATDGSNMFDDSVGSCTIRIINGRLIRTGGTTSSYVFNFNLGQTQIDIVNVYAENAAGPCLFLPTIQKFNGTGSTFVGNSGTAVQFNSGNSIKGGTYINKGAGNNNIISSKISNITAEVNGGRNVVGGFINNSQFYATTGKACNVTTADSVVSNCFAKSTTGEAAQGLNSAKAINCTFISDTGIAAYQMSLINCYITSAALNYVIFNSNLIEGCNIVNTSTGSSRAIYNGSSTNAKVINNTIELSGTGIAIDLAGATDARVLNNTIKASSTTTIAIKQYANDAYIFGNILKGSTNMVNTTTGVNLWVATTDAQGNSAQL